MHPYLSKIEEIRILNPGKKIDKMKQINAVDSSSSQCADGQQQYSPAY